MSFHLRRFCFVMVPLFLTTCSGGVERKVHLRFTIGGPFQARAASPVTGFPCFGVMVTGDKIRPKDGSSDKGMVPPNFCGYPGASSGFVALAANGTHMDVLVPAASALLIQVVALDSTDATCPTSSVSEFMVDARKNGTPLAVKGLYEVGRFPVNDGLNSDQAVNIQNSYDSTAPRDLLSCSGSLSLQLKPSSYTNIESGGNVMVQAAGGRGKFTYALTGGGSITSDGLFTAPTGGSQTSLITVSDTDNSLLRATTRVKTFTPTITPYYWYTANSYTSFPAQGILDPALTSNYWINQGSYSGFDLHVVTNTTGVHTYLPGESNGFPAIDFATEANMHLSGANSPTLYGVHAFVVAKINAGTSGNIFCLAATGSTCDSGYTGVALFADSTTNVVRGQVSISTPPTLIISASTISSGYQVYEVQADLPSSGGSAVTLKKNGNAMSTGATANTGSFAQSGGYLLLAQAATAGSSSVNADIAEVMIFSQVLSGTDATDTRNYLRAKYRLP
jgi:hypothetical protein